MKLFLKTHVEERALKVWDSIEAIQDYKNRLSVRRNKIKTKRINKNIRDLRRKVLCDQISSDQNSHTHNFCITQISETNFSKTCTSCGFQLDFEQM
ncbi:hypothetical protein HZS_3067 [Henneguya salminicola]|nr:hypothetical protein HZS_3067 [Henneguya salminicola]